MELCHSPRSTRPNARRYTRRTALGLECSCWSESRRLELGWSRQLRVPLDLTCASPRCEPCFLALRPLRSPGPCPWGHGATRRRRSGSATRSCGFRREAPTKRASATDFHGGDDAAEQERLQACSALLRRTRARHRPHVGNAWDPLVVGRRGRSSSSWPAFHASRMAKAPLHPSRNPTKRPEESATETPAVAKFGASRSDAHSLNVKWFCVGMRSSRLSFDDRGGVAAVGDLLLHAACATGNGPNASEGTAIVDGRGTRRAPRGRVATRSR